MNYLENRAAYYTLFVAELTQKSVEDVFAALSPIFLIKRSDKKLRRLITDRTLGSLTTTVAATVYGNYIRSFCRDSAAFGLRADEAEVLELKKGILQTLDEFKKSLVLSPLIALAENYEKLKLSVVYALTLYVRNRSASATYIRILQSAVADADGMDACIALMFLDKTRAADRYAMLKIKAAYDLYPELNTALAKRYKLGSVTVPASRAVWS